MSFAGDVKKELSEDLESARHCRIAELAAILSFSGTVMISAGNRISFKVQTENLGVARKSQALLEQAFDLHPQCCTRIHGKKSRRRLTTTYYIVVPQQEDAVRVLRSTHILDEKLELSEKSPVADELIVQRSCCKRAFLRGAFLCGGSISDPHKSYHFEITCPDEPMAHQLQDMIAVFGPSAKIVTRKSKPVLYIKESGQVADMLRIIGADRSLLDLENIRIEHELVNSVNRKLNCDTANINKIVQTSQKQAEDIEYIERKIGLTALPDNLREMALVRVRNRELSLEDLGKMMNPPLGKSGVHHRLQKISAVAQKIREKEKRGDAS